MCHGQLLDHAMRKARKPHRCDSCNRTIIPGEVYERQLQRDDNTVITWKGCRDCSVKNRVMWQLHGIDACYTDPQSSAPEDARDAGWREYRKLLRGAAEALFGGRK